MHARGVMCACQQVTIYAMFRLHSEEKLTLTCSWEQEAPEMETSQNVV